MPPPKCGSEKPVGRSRRNVLGVLVTAGASAATVEILIAVPQSVNFRLSRILCGTGRTCNVWIMPGREKLPTNIQTFEGCQEMLRLTVRELESLVESMKEASVNSFECESKMLVSQSEKMLKWAMSVRVDFLKSQITKRAERPKTLPPRRPRRPRSPGTP